MGNTMQTLFKFVFESAGGGDVPGTDVGAQTGDWLAILLVSLCAIVAAISMVYVFVKSKKVDQPNHANAAQANTATSVKMVFATVLAILAIGAAVFSLANMQSIRAFANGKTGGVDYKDEITATVHESDQSISFDTNFFTNLETGKMHIDHSKLSLTPEAKAIIGQETFKFEVSYLDGTTLLFDYQADEETYKPFDQTALSTNETQQIEYKTTLSYETAKKLCDLENVFVLELDQALCYTINFTTEGAESGYAPLPQTVSVNTGDPSLEQITIPAPENTGGLTLPGYEFSGWNTQLDGEGTHYDVGDPISAASGSDIVIYPDWKRVDPYHVSFEATEGGSVSSSGMDVEPYLAINVDGSTLNIGTKYSVEATATEDKYQFDEWVIVEGGIEKPIKGGETVTSPMTFRAKFSLKTFTMHLVPNGSNVGTVTPEYIYNIVYGTQVFVDATKIYFGSDSTKNYSIAKANDHYHFVSWQVFNGLKWVDVTPGMAIDSDTNFRAIFDVDTFTVNFAAGDHGSVVVAGSLEQVQPQTVPYGTTWEITKYQTYDNCVVLTWPNSAKTYVVQPVATSPYVFSEWTHTTPTNAGTIIESNLDFTATFKLDMFTMSISTNSETMGSVSPTSIPDVPGGSEIHADNLNKKIYFGNDASKNYSVASANANYHFVQWQYWNGSAWVDAAGLPPVSDNMKFRALFEVDTFTVSFAAAENGSVLDVETGLAPTDQTVPYGTTWAEKKYGDYENCIVLNWTDTNNAEHTYAVRPVADATYIFDKWTQTTPTNDGTISSNTLFTASFVHDLLTMTIVSNDVDKGTVNPGTIENITIDTPIKTNNNVIYFGSTQTTTNSSKAEKIGNNHFVKWQVWNGDKFVDLEGGETVTGSMTFQAVFEVDTFTVSFAAAENGNVVNADTNQIPTDQTVPYGTTWEETKYADHDNCIVLKWTDSQNTEHTYAVRPVALSSFKFDKWTQTSPKNGGTISSDTLFTASFIQNAFNMTIISNDANKGSVNPATVQNITLGTPVKTNNDVIYFGASATSSNSSKAEKIGNNHFVKWQVWNGDKFVDLTGEEVVTGEMKFQAVFEIDTFKINFAAGDNGNVYRAEDGTVPVEEQTVPYGATWSQEKYGNFENCIVIRWKDSTQAQQTYAVKPVAKTTYKFSTWENEEPTNTETLITSDLNFKAIFEEDLYTMTIQSASTTMGTVDPASVENVLIGSKIAVDATSKKLYFGNSLGQDNYSEPKNKTGHHFVKWQVWNGESYVDLQSTETVTGAMKFQAVFEIDTFKINFAAGDNGKVYKAEGGTVPVEEQTVPYGTTWEIKKHIDFENCLVLTWPASEGNPVQTYAVKPVPDNKYIFNNWTPSTTTNEGTLITADTKFTASFTQNLFTMTIGVNDANMGTVDHEVVEDIALNTPIKTEGTVIYFGTSKTSDNYSTASKKDHYHFVKWQVWNGKDAFVDLTGSETVTGGMQFRAVFEIDTFDITFASADTSQGDVYVAGTQTSATKQTVPYGATWEEAKYSDYENCIVLKWTDSNNTEQTYAVQPVAKTIYEFDKWAHETPENQAQTITSNLKFTASFKKQMVTLTYKVVDENNPHGFIQEARGGDKITKFEENIEVDAQSAQGVYVNDEEVIQNKYTYYYESWTQGNQDVSGWYDSSQSQFIPEKPTSGLWTDAEFVVHFATPRAIYSEDSASGEKIMTFTYDEEDHNEAKDSATSNKYKFVVNNSKLDFDGDMSNTTITVPTWFNPARINSGTVVSPPTPIVQPTKVVIDPKFKNYNGLTSTDMWFMDSCAIPAMISILDKDYAMQVGASFNNFEDKKLKSVEGLENIPLQNLESTAFMFGHGKTVFAQYANLEMDAHLECDPDNLVSLDFSSWQNTSAMTGSMLGMFAGCNNLTELNLPDTFAGESTNIMGMFAGCESLTSFTAKGTFGASTETVLGLFFGCTNLKEFALDSSAQNGNTSFGKNTENYQYMFNICSALNRIDISTANAEPTAPDPVKLMFYDAENIVTMNLPEGWIFTADEMHLDTDADWYKLIDGEYKEFPEEKIEQAKGGLLTRYCAKAIYEEATANAQSTLTFYYDYKIHEEGEEFIVPVSDSEGASMDFFPSWYDVKFYLDDEQVSNNKLTDLITDYKERDGKKLTSSITLKAPAKTVIFDDSFQNTENLTNINFWFIADNHGHTDVFNDFYSLDVASETPSAANYGFDNLPSVNLEWAINAFGGFSFEAFVNMFLERCTTYDFESDQDQYFEGCDTYSSATGSLDLETLKFKESENYTKIELIGLCANACGRTEIKVPKTTPADAAGMFMNCRSLTKVGDFKNLTWDINTTYTKMFYGCSSLTTLDLTNIDTRKIDIKRKQTYYNILGQCNSLKSFNINENWWLSMDVCRLPYDAENPWTNSTYASKQFTPDEIPTADGKGNVKYTGVFERGNTTTKDVKITAGSGGKLDPTIEKVQISGPTNYSISQNTLNINGKQITAVPNSGNKVKAWYLNGERIFENTYGSYQDVLDFNETNEFTVTFTDKDLEPKAVYDAEASTLTFYYDKETHQDEGTEVFPVYDDTGFDIDLETGKYTCKMPAWYDYSISGDLNVSDLTFKFNSTSKVAAENVVFTKGFADYDSIVSISMWFMADSKGNQSFKKFYSPDESGQLNETTEGFANLNTSCLNNVAYAFGGFSLLPFVGDLFGDELVAGLMQAVKAGGDGRLPAAVWDEVASLIKVFSFVDTYGTSIENLDLSTFDVEHHVSDFSAMFCNCRELNQVDLGANIGDANITNLRAMFQNCERFGLTPGITQPILNLDKLDTSKVTNFNLMFFGDFGIKSLDLSNFNTISAIYAIEKANKMNAVLTFYDCTRLSELTLTCHYDESLIRPDVMLPVKGWSVPMTLTGIPDTVVTPGVENMWTNDEYPGKEWSNGCFPYVLSDIAKLNKGEVPPEDVFFEGTFKREDAPDYKSIFKTVDKTKGLVNAEESVDYVYVRNDTVKLDPNDSTALLSDNFKIQAQPIDGFRFSHWEYLTDPADPDSGKVVTPQDEYYFEAKNAPEDQVFVACFEAADLKAKAVYTPPAAGSNDNVATMEFVYDDNTDYDPGVVVFDINPNADAYNLPPWFENAGLPTWIEGETRPMISFVDEIDDGVNRPDLIKIEFDDSFVHYKQLTSLSGWFAPALNKGNTDALYQPFVFDAENFTGLKYINTTNIYNVENMFGGHENASEISGGHVTSIDLSGFDQGVDGVYAKNSLKNINGLFAGCLDMEELILHEGFGANCTSMVKTFFNCKKMVGETMLACLSNLDTSKVSDMSYMFARYKNAAKPVNYNVEDTTTLTFPKDFNTQNVMKIDGMFSGYTDTINLIINSEAGRTIPVTSPASAKYLFANTTNFVTCEGESQSNYLSTIDISGCSWFDTSKVISMQGMFKNCSALSTTSFIGTDNFIQGSDLTDLSYMFSGCTSLENLNWGEHFSTSTVKNMNYMFANSGIKSFSFPDMETNQIFLTSSLLSCAYMFSGCLELESVVLQRTIADQTNYIWDARFMFENCTKLTDIDLKGFYIYAYQLPDPFNQDDESTMHWPAENMFSLNINGLITDNLNIKEVKIGGNWSCIAQDEDNNTYYNHPADNMGLYAVDEATATEVNWYLKEIPINEPVQLSQIKDKSIPLSDAYTFTWEEPQKVSYTPNKAYWGSVNSTPSEQEYAPFYDTITFKYRMDGSNALMTQYPMGVSVLLTPVAKNNATFKQWNKKVDDVVTKIEPGADVVLTSDTTLEAEFEGGDQPYVGTMYPLATDNQSGLSNADEYVASYLVLMVTNEAFVKQFKDLGVIEEYWEIPDDGDWGSEGAPYTKGDYKDHIEASIIYTNMADYDGFTTFKGWFENLKNLSLITDEEESGTGINSLNFKNIESIENMFKGCSSLEKLNFSTKKAQAVQNKVNATNAFNGCTSLRDLNLDLLTQYTDETTDVFSNCSSLARLSISQQFNKNLGNLGFGGSGKKYVASYQNTVLPSTAADIQSHMAKVTSNKPSVICLAKDAATVNSNDSNAKFSESQTGPFDKDTLTISFNNSAGFNASVADNENALRVSYSAKLDGTLPASWDVIIYKQDQKPANVSMFYFWKYADLPLTKDPQALKNDDSVTAFYDVPKELYSLFDADLGTLTLRYDGNAPTNGDTTKYPLPNQWSKQCGGQKISPWDNIKADVTTVVIDEGLKDCSTLYDSYAWFYDFEHLDKVEGLQNLKYNSSFNPSFKSMFENCAALTSVDFGNMSTSFNDADYSEMFRNCSELTEVNLNKLIKPQNSKFKPLSMFTDCTKLNKVTFGEKWKGASIADCGVSTPIPWINIETGQSFAVSDFPNGDIQGSYGTFELATKIASFESIDSSQGTIQGMPKVGYSEAHPASYKVNDDNTLSIFVKGDNEEYYDNRVIAKKQKGFFFDHWTLNANPLNVGDTGPLTDNAAFTVYWKEDTNRPYAVYNGDTHTLTLKYCEKVDDPLPAGWMEVDDSKSQENRSIFTDVASQKETTKIVVDSSFVNAEGFTNMNGWFSEFVSVENIEGLQYLNTSEVTTMRCMFYRCYSLKSLDVHAWDTSCLQNMFNMFSEMDNLETLTFIDANGNSNWHTENVYDFGSAVYGCPNLKTLDLSCFSIVGKSKNGYVNLNAFIYRLNSLRELNICYKDFSPKEIEGGPWYIEHNPNISLIHSNGKDTVEHYETPGNWIKPNGDIRYNRMSIIFDQVGDYYREVILSAESSDSYGGTITNYTEPLRYFPNQTTAKYSTDGQTLTITTGDGQSYTFTAQVVVDTFSFQGWEVKPQIAAGANITCSTTFTANFVDSNHGRAYFKDGTLTFAYGKEDLEGEYVDVPKDYANIEYTSETSSPFVQFAKQTEHVVIDQSFAGFKGIKSLACWFKDFTAVKSYEGLEYINLESMQNRADIDGQSYIYGITRMFENNWALETLDIYKLNTRSVPGQVTETSRIFKNCFKLKNLNLYKPGDPNTSNFDFSASNYAVEMFQNCLELTSLDFTYQSYMGLEKNGWQCMDGMFCGCIKLQTLNFGNQYLYPGIANWRVFCRCNSLTEIKVNNSDSEYRGWFEQAGLDIGTWTLQKPGEDQPSPVRLYDLNGLVNGTYHRNEATIMVTLNGSGDGAKYACVTDEKYMGDRNATLTEIPMVAGTKIIKSNDNFCQCFFENGKDRGEVWQLSLRSLNPYDYPYCKWMFESPYVVSDTDHALDCWVGSNWPETNNVNAQQLIQAQPNPEKVDEAVEQDYNYIEAILELPVFSIIWHWLSA